LVDGRNYERTIDGLEENGANLGAQSAETGLHTAHTAAVGIGVEDMPTAAALDDRAESVGVVAQHYDDLAQAVQPVCREDVLQEAAAVEFDQRFWLTHPRRSAGGQNDQAKPVKICRCEWAVR
jgi:hypothetical protein